MDPEIASLLTEVDSMVNTLMLNMNFPVDRLKDIQDKRNDIKNKIQAFIAQTEDRNKHFHDEVKSNIEDLRHKIQGLQS